MAAFSTFAVVSASLIGFYFVVPWLVKHLLARRLTRRVLASGSACLTFDDGPDPVTTDLILDELDRAGVKATFFALGRQVERHPEIARRILQSGHELGEHGYDHLHAWKTAPWRYLRDLLRGGVAIARHLPPGRRPPFRPPYGELNLLTLLYLWLTNRPLVMWNVNPRDFEAASAAAVAGSVGERLGAGSVVLLHDARADLATDPHITVDAVRLLLTVGSVRSLRLTTIAGALCPDRISRAG
jgi:peptidoglycan/xylan/chitin deacetylase (PgdA/CDA1 family)